MARLQWGRVYGYQLLVRIVVHTPGTAEIRPAKGIDEDKVLSMSATAVGGLEAEEEMAYREQYHVAGLPRNIPGAEALLVQEQKGAM